MNLVLSMKGFQDEISRRAKFSLGQEPVWAYCQSLSRYPGGGGVPPYMGYISMRGPKGYGFSAVLVINRVSILADFGHFGLK